jgi:GNAT superfamily N-acetyltransferase
MGNLQQINLQGQCGKQEIVPVKKEEDLHQMPLQMPSRSGSSARYRRRMKLPEIAVRHAPVDFADWERVRALILDAFASMEGRIDPPSSALRLTPQSMAADAAKGALLLAEREGALVGCVFVRPKEDALHIGKLAVRPDLQGSGIGKALVTAARAEARARGLTALELQTRIELAENHAAFARMGFVKSGETAHPGYDRPTSITMRATV